MQIGHYIEMVHKSEKDLAEAFRMVAKEHTKEPDIKEMCELLATWSDELNHLIHPFIAKYGKQKGSEPDRLFNSLFGKPRKGSMGVLRDLQDLWLMANEGEVCALILRQAASAIRDQELITVCDKIEKQSQRQVAWLLTRMKSSAPQTLIAAS